MKTAYPKNNLKDVELLFYGKPAEQKGVNFIFSP
jgi:hypothetical protein